MIKAGTFLQKFKVLYWSVIPILIDIVLSGSVFYRDGPRYPAYVRAICAALYKTLGGGLIAVLFAGLIMKLESKYFY